MSEFAPDGTRISRHDAPDDTLPVADTSGGCREAFERHLGRVLGAEPTVFHELISDVVHLDIYIYPPTPTRPYTVLATSGMSDLPMTVPEVVQEDSLAEGRGSLERAELLLALPPEWPLTQEAFEDERRYWPVRLLKGTARLPHLYRTWLGIGHTVPNGDPARPYAPGTELSGIVLLPPVLDELKDLGDPEKVPELRFYAVVPLTSGEMDLKLTHGLETLLNHLNEAGVTELLTPDRVTAAPVPKRSWLQRLRG
ncbi:suppressor of fused domain protein [Deinococcus ficus]|uniref:suppressor of fused domain protein n=1 Tax=Deinococcus ficus TaxID=317577 RepID=UPI000688AADB|nr:suppressor of fused domain protein [Deinococcus ficus]